MSHCETYSNVVYVAVGVIFNDQNQVLIAKRPEHVHQGGLWEFPGGKIDNNEATVNALRRELDEELGIQITASRPLITIPHRYADKRVYLDVHIIERFSGMVSGNEGQDIRWVDRCELQDYSFPAANKAIITAIQLPERYLITGKVADFDECERKIQSALEQGIRLIQLRQKDLSESEFLSIANRLCRMLESSSTKLILNTSIELFVQTDADGIHFTGERLRHCEQRPVAVDKLFSASTHRCDELLHAAEIGADFAMLSPVLATSSHPGEPAIGWNHFADIVKVIPIPVYALGGMTDEHIKMAHKMGAQGIAAISAIWNTL